MAEASASNHGRNLMVREDKMHSQLSLWALLPKSEADACSTWRCTARVYTRLTTKIFYYPPSTLVILFLVRMVHSCVLGWTRTKFELEISWKWVVEKQEFTRMYPRYSKPCSVKLDIHTCMGPGIILCCLVLITHCFSVFQNKLHPFHMSLRHCDRI